MTAREITVALVSVEGVETDRIVWPNIYFDTSTLTSGVFTPGLG